MSSGRIEEIALEQAFQRTELVGLNTAETIERYTNRDKSPSPGVAPLNYQPAAGIVPRKRSHPSKFRHAVQQLLLRAANIFRGKLNRRAHEPEGASASANPQSE